MSIPTLTAITFDCRDVMAQATFWSRLLERPLAPDASGFVAAIGEIRGPPSATPTLLFLSVPDAREPAKNPVHIDLHADDLDAATQRAVELGAEFVAHFDEYGIEWVTLQDPEGNLFDIGRSVTLA